jgi:hypothetical protein
LNLAHLHLLLNHWPIIGTFIGVALLLVSLAGRSNHIRQASYGLFAFMALLSIPAYLSGNAAAEATRELSFSASLVESHEGAAMMAFIYLGLTGTFALYGMWQYRQDREDASRDSKLCLAVVLTLSLATAGLMAVAGNTGGNIRHPEVMEALHPPSAVEGMGAGLILELRYFVIESSRWAWPMVENLHFIGLILILGTVGLLNIRVLGFLKQLPVGPLHRLLPLGIAGFVINAVTGVLFFIGMPYFYVLNTYFQAKIAVILLAGGNLLLFYCTGIFRKWDEVGPKADAPLFAKLVAAASLILWLSVIVIGRYIPVGEV